MIMIPTKTGRAGGSREIESCKMPVYSTTSSLSTPAAASATSGVDVPVAFPLPLAVALFFFFFLFLEEETCGRVRISKPVSVILLVSCVCILVVAAYRMVSSNCAEYRPSSVTAVQSSRQWSRLAVPRLIIGSCHQNHGVELRRGLTIVKTWPASIRPGVFDPP